MYVSTLLDRLQLLRWTALMPTILASNSDICNLYISYFDSHSKCTIINC